MKRREEAGKVIKIAVVGAGIYGKVHIDALSQRERKVGDVRLVGFVDTDDATREKIEYEYGLRGYSNHLALIEKESPDAITVVTPDHLHYQVVMDCIDAGVATLVEKPFATDIAEAKEMAYKARESGILVQIDFHKRFDPYHLDLKMRIQEGELGKIEYGYCWMEDVLKVGTEMIGKKSWQGQGSPAWFLGIHMIDLTYWMMDFPKAVKVYATGQKGKLQSMGIDIFDSIKAVVVYENGAAITYDTAVILPDSHESIVRQGVKMVGTDGFMEIDSQYRGARGCTCAKGMETPNLGMRYRRADKGGDVFHSGYLFESIYDFVENIQYLQEDHNLDDLEGRYASPEQGIETTKIGVAIHQSIESGGLCLLSEMGGGSQ